MPHFPAQQRQRCVWLYPAAGAPADAFAAAWRPVLRSTRSKRSLGCCAHTRVSHLSHSPGRCAPCAVPIPMSHRRFVACICACPPLASVLRSCMDVFADGAINAEFWQVVEDSLVPVCSKDLCTMLNTRDKDKPNEGGAAQEDPRAAKAQAQIGQFVAALERAYSRAAAGGLETGVITCVLVRYTPPTLQVALTGSEGESKEFSISALDAELN